MQNAGRNRFLVHLKLCQNNAYPKRMNDICLSGFSELICMGLARQLICFFNQRNIC